ncbi:SPOR domain-containing protein [Psychrobium sp. nBUS_13]|uniref:SPOR domain-containing protein n=1 Tax=Psychrobium sp. nBUS_13 TaxID=3395319 RepID=UPI003EB7B20C
MSDQIKNRVVGAVVLFALAIIFLPKIFDGEKESQRQAFVKIPTKPTHQQPDVSKIELSKPPVDIKQNDKVVQENSAEAHSTVQAVKDAAKTNERDDIVTKSAHKEVTKSTIAAPIKAKGWVIRMGSFGNPSNVNTLLKNLRKKGFTAYSVPAVPRAGVTNKVYVGPELDKKKLQSLQPKLKKAFKESGVIEKYNPIN